MKTNKSIFQILDFSGTTFCGLDINFTFNGNKTNYLISNLSTQLFSGHILENNIIKYLEMNTFDNYQILNIMKNIFPGKNIANTPFYVDNIYLYFIVMNDNYKIEYLDNIEENNILNTCGINIFEYVQMLDVKLMKVNVNDINKIRYNKKTYTF